MPERRVGLRFDVCIGNSAALNPSMHATRSSRSGPSVLLTTGLALATTPAWASRFATGFDVVFAIGVLGALAGLGALVGVLAGRSRASLIAGSCLAAWAAREWFLGGGWLGVSAGPGGASLANLAALAALLGYVAGWAVARWPGGHRRIVIAALACTAAVLVSAWFEPVLALLALPLPAVLIPLAVGIGVRRAFARLGGAGSVRRAVDNVLRALRGAGSRAAALRLAGGVAAVQRFVQRSRARRAWLSAGLAYLMGWIAVLTANPPSLTMLRWAMEPGRMLHSMLSGDVQPWPEMAIAWLVYGPVAAVLLGVLSLALPLARAKAGAITSSEAG